MCHKLKLTNQEFIKRAKQVHGDKYFYGITKYLGAFKRVNVYCRKHDRLFRVYANDHIQGRGCSICRKEKLQDSVKLPRVSIQEFIERANLAHKGLYDYSQVAFTHTSNKITIGCAEHGPFLQEVTKHLLGSGCPKCAHSRNKNGWSYTVWENIGKSSAHFESFKLYVIRLYNTDGEEFYKIGKTFRAITDRIVRGGIPYSFEVLKVVQGTAGYISALEHRLQKAHSQWKYVPTLKFNGSTECFSHINLKEIDEN